MGSPAKFLFDRLRRDREGQVSVSLVDHATSLAERRRGVRKGRSAAKAEADQRTTAALSRIAAALDLPAAACPASQHCSRRKLGEVGRGGGKKARTPS